MASLIVIVRITASRNTAVKVTTVGHHIFTTRNDFGLEGKRYFLTGFRVKVLA